MKRYIKCAKSSDSDAVLSILKDHNIDTTMCQYELRAEAYERYTSGKVYTKKFKCPGDYLAYFSMVVHKAPTGSAILEYFDLDEFAELVDHYPTVAKIKQVAEQSWYGDGDDYIISLKNLTTGDVLYEADYYEEDEDEEDWE